MGDHQKEVSMVLKGDLSFKTITILLNVINRVCKSVIVIIQWIPLRQRELLIVIGGLGCE